jgi:hypothetical protein
MKLTPYGRDVVTYEETDYKGFNHEELKKAFEKAINPEDWRAPIHKIIRREDLEVTIAAIEYYTGCEVRVWEPPIDGSPTVKVTADGYRNGPCGP